MEWCGCSVDDIWIREENWELNGSSQSLAGRRKIKGKGIKEI